MFQIIDRAAPACVWDIACAKHAEKEMDIEKPPAGGEQWSLTLHAYQT
jgi:hypothetical protein